MTTLRMSACMRAPRVPLHPRHVEAREALAGLREDQAMTARPILVEGPRDVAALRSLGITGPIEVVNRGWDLARRVAHLVETYGTRGVDGGPAIHVLMDWDRTGGRLQTTFRRRLEAFDVKIDEDVRRVLMRCLKPETRTVEGLSGLVEVLGVEGR
jgi:5S rRNA maturation endonuclease (ribonuclease M5)